MADKKFKKYFPDGLDQDEILSRPPKGYEADNPAIEYLKLKSFVTTRAISDELLASKSLLKEVLGTFTAMKPFINFLNRAIE